MDRCFTLPITMEYDADLAKRRLATHRAACFPAKLNVFVEIKSSLDYLQFLLHELRCISLSTMTVPTGFHAENWLSPELYTRNAP